MKRMLRIEVPVDDAEHTFEIREIKHIETRDPYVVEVWFEAIEGPQGPMPTRILRVFGTGQPIPDGWAHLGTAVVRQARLVWHLYEKVEPASVGPEGLPCH